MNNIKYEIEIKDTPGMDIPKMANIGQPNLETRLLTEYELLRNDPRTGVLERAEKYKFASDFIKAIGENNATNTSKSKSYTSTETLEHINKSNVSAKAFYENANAMDIANIVLTEIEAENQ